MGIYSDLLEIKGIVGITGQLKKYYKHLETTLSDHNFSSNAINGYDAVTLMDKAKIKTQKRGWFRKRGYQVPDTYQFEDVFNKNFFSSLKKITKGRYKLNDVAIVDRALLCVSSSIGGLFKRGAWSEINYQGAYDEIGKILTRCNKGKKVSEAEKYVFCQLSCMMITNGGDVLTAPNGLKYDYSREYEDGVRFFNKKAYEALSGLDQRKRNEELRKIDSSQFVFMDDFFNRTTLGKSRQLIDSKILLDQDLLDKQKALEESWGPFRKRKLRSDIKRLNQAIADNMREVRTVFASRGRVQNIWQDYYREVVQIKVAEFVELQNSLDKLNDFLINARNPKRQRKLNDGIEFLKSELDVKKREIAENLMPTYGSGSLSSDQIDSEIRKIKDGLLSGELSKDPNFLSFQYFYNFDVMIEELLGDYETRKYYGKESGILSNLITEFVKSEEFATLGVDYMRQALNWAGGENNNFLKFVKRCDQALKMSNNEFLDFFATEVNDLHKNSFKSFCRDEFKRRLSGDGQFLSNLVNYVNYNGGIKLYMSLVEEFGIDDSTQCLNVILSQPGTKRDPAFVYLGCLKSSYQEIEKEILGATDFDIRVIMKNVNKMLALKSQYNMSDEIDLMKSKFSSLLPDYENKEAVSAKFIELMEFCEQVSSMELRALDAEYNQVEAQSIKQPNKGRNQAYRDPVDEFKLDYIQSVKDAKELAAAGVFRRVYKNRPEIGNVSAAGNVRRSYNPPSSHNQTGYVSRQGNPSYSYVPSWLTTSNTRRPGQSRSLISSKSSYPGSEITPHSSKKLYVPALNNSRLESWI